MNTDVGHHHHAHLSGLCEEVCGAKDESGERCGAAIPHKVFVNEVGYDETKQLARALPMRWIGLVVL